MAYYTDVFDRLAETKKRTILETATNEFSALGYNAANINVIAKKCGVSVGALYKYFKTKENLFLAVCTDAVRQLAASLEKVENCGKDLLGKIEMLLRIIQHHSRQHSSLINLYNEITTEANNELADRLSFEMESLSSKYYNRLIAEAKAKGEISPYIDVGIFSFCLDNLFMSLQFSYASEYYKERMRIYTDKNIFEDDERVVAGMMQFIRNALGPKK